VARNLPKSVYPVKCLPREMPFYFYFTGAFLFLFHWGLFISISLGPFYFYFTGVLQADAFPYVSLCHLSRFRPFKLDRLVRSPSCSHCERSEAISWNV